MDPVRVVNFTRPRHVIKGYVIQKKAQRLTLELPHGTQILGAEDHSHNGTLMLWAMQSVEESTPKVTRSFLVVPEEMPFEIGETEECECGGHMPFVQPIGMWVDRVVSKSGDITVYTGHILEIVQEFDEDID